MGDTLARHARRYGGVAGLSGGPIGPEGRAREYAGSPVLLGCSDVDPHIPTHGRRAAPPGRRRHGPALYPHMGHTIDRDELDVVRHMVGRVVR